MGKWKSNTLHSGGPDGPKVKSQKQAVAIMLSEKRNEQAHGGHYKEGHHAPKKSKTRLGRM